MKRMLVIAVAGLMLVSPVMAQELKKVSLDDATSIGLKIQSDATIKVTLNVVINGTGTVWVDDIVLSKESL